MLNSSSETRTPDRQEGGERETQASKERDKRYRKAYDRQREKGGTGIEGNGFVFRLHSTQDMPELIWGPEPWGDDQYTVLYMPHN
jgi:hypothetical protein